MTQQPTYKVWIELSRKAAENNLRSMRSLVKPETKIWAVVKSNAYGHGIYTFSKMIDELGVDGFCVDSVIEGSRLRDLGITKPILVIGPTLPVLFDRAAQNNITLSISNQTALDELINWQKACGLSVAVHIKVDTGMHRQGFYNQDLDQALRTAKAAGVNVTGIYSHFAASKDPADLSYNAQQKAAFETALATATAAGFPNLIRHLGATSSTMVGPDYQYDAVRIGIGLYGVFPSEKLEARFRAEIVLQPVLSMYAVVSEIKLIPKGEGIGYDLTETMSRDTKAAVIPIGYWHGLPRTLSGKGEVLIGGKRCKILGLISMDMLSVDVTDTTCAAGDIATIIGTSDSQTLTARELGKIAGTTPHEILVRSNPLIERFAL